MGDLLQLVPHWVMVLLQWVEMGLSELQQQPFQQRALPSSLVRPASQLGSKSKAMVACLLLGQLDLALDPGFEEGVVEIDLVVLVGSHKEGMVREGSLGVQDTIQEEVRHKALEGNHQGREEEDQRDPIQLVGDRTADTVGDERIGEGHLVMDLVADLEAGPDFVAGDLGKIDVAVEELELELVVWDGIRSVGHFY